MSNYSKAKDGLTIAATRHQSLPAKGNSISMQLPTSVYQSENKLDQVMARLLLTLLLIAFVPLTHAGVGDVYYCVPDRADSIRSDEGLKELKDGRLLWMCFLERTYKKPSFLK